MLKSQSNINIMSDESKRANQAIRPIITQANASKQQYNIISPAKSLTDLSQITTVSMADNSNNVQDRVTIRSPQLINEKDNQKTTPVKLSSSTNIGLAITRNLSNKVPVTSSKSSKRSLSPVKLVQEWKVADNPKDDCREKIMNSLQDNGSHSSTRKRARKQQLKSVYTKMQILNTNLPSTTSNDNSQNASTNLNSIRPIITDKPTTLASYPLDIPAKPLEDQKLSSFSIGCSNINNRITKVDKTEQTHSSNSNGTTSLSSNSVKSQTTPFIKEIISPLLTSYLINSFKLKNLNNLQATSCSWATASMPDKLKILYEDMSAINLKSKLETDSLNTEHITLIPHLSNNLINMPFKRSIYSHRCYWNSGRYPFEKA